MCYLIRATAHSQPLHEGRATGYSLSLPDCRRRTPESVARMCCDQRILIAHSLTDLLPLILRKVDLPRVDISQVAIIEITLGEMSGGPPARGT